MLRARESFAFTDKNGIPRVVSAGQEVYADDPNVKGREHLFEAGDARLQRAANLATETASAAPGERRIRSRRTSSATADSPPKADDAEKKGGDA